MDTFESLTLGPLHLANRLLMAPVKTAFAGTDGRVTDRLIAYYARRARGGVGAIIVEPMFVDAAGKEHPKQLSIDSDDAIVGLRHLVEAIHDGGARVIAHLNHAGRAANPKASGQTPEAPSVLACPTTGAIPEAMSTDRVEEVIAAFGAAAGRARAAGFDAIEVQCGLGYLVSQFFSARTNQRNDDWGGTPEKRARFPERLITAVCDAAGDGVAVIARLSGTEQIPGGLTKADAIHLGQMLSGLGVAAIHVVSGSACDSPPWYYQHMSLPAGVNAQVARELREHLEVPVIAAGRLGDPDVIRRLFDEDAVDMIALGRPLVADPDLPAKLHDGHPERVVQCGACLQGCLAGVKSGRGLGCIVNPELGREGEEPSPAGDAQRVVVVGGGPAGLTAARIAADRGHVVIVLERSQVELGGQFALSHLAPGKQAMRHTLESLVREAVRSGAEIRMGVVATASDVMALAPDVVIVATGAEPIIPKIAGLTGAVTGERVLTGAADLGRRVLVIGGGLVGIEVAEYLAERSHDVVVVEMLGEIAGDMEPVTRKLTLKRLSDLPVTIHTETTVDRLADGHALVRGPEGERDLGSFDSVVTAVGTRPLDSLSQELSKHKIHVHTIGDAVALGQVQGAVMSAWELASRL